MNPLLLLYLKKYWKYIALAALVGVIVYYMWSSIVDYGDARYRAGFASREADYEEARKKQTRDHIAEMTRQQEQANEISKGFQTAIQIISARKPGPSVVLCDGPARLSSGTGQPTDNSASGSNATPQSELPPTRRDIGPTLFAITDDADAVTAQLNSLQRWVNNVCLKPASL